MRKFLTLLAMIAISASVFAQKEVTKFMGIPVDGSPTEMIKKLKAKGFTEKTQENEVGVELKGKYLGKDVWLRIYNSNKSKTVYLIDIFFKKGQFMDLYEQYLSKKGNQKLWK